MTAIYSSLRSANRLIQRGLAFYTENWDKILLVSLGILAAAGIYLFLSVTKNFGTVIGGDAVDYIWGARNLAHGIGLGRLDGAGNLKILPDWPPLYPGVLAVFEVVGIGAREGSRYVGAFLFGSNIFLIGLIIARLTRSYWFSLLGALVVALSPNFARTSFAAMTDPLYIFLSLCGVLCLAVHCEGWQKKWLVLLGTALALLFLTRFAGLSFILACLVTLALQFERPALQRIKDIALLSAIGFVPMALWLLRNSLYADNTINKTPAIRHIPASQFEALSRVLDSITKPLGTIFHVGSGKLAAAAAALAALAGRLYFSKPRAADPVKPGYPVIILLLIYCVTYSAIVVFSKLFLDSNISFSEDRFTAPLFVNLVILGSALFSRIWQEAWLKLRPLAFLLTVVYVFIYVSIFTVYTNDTSAYLLPISRNGGGYSNTMFTEAGFVRELSALPRDHVIFTDNIEMLYFYSGHHSYAFYDTDPKTIDFVRQNMHRKNGAIFVFFNEDDALAGVIQSQFPEMGLTYEDFVSIYIQNK